MASSLLARKQTNVRVFLNMAEERGERGFAVGAKSRDLRARLETDADTDTYIHLQRKQTGHSHKN